MNQVRLTQHFPDITLGNKLRRGVAYAFDPMKIYFKKENNCLSGRSDS